VYYLYDFYSRSWLLSVGRRGLTVALLMWIFQQAVLRSVERSVWRCILPFIWVAVWLLSRLNPSTRVLSNDDCPDDERDPEDYQNCFVLYCIRQLCTVICTHIWAVLTVDYWFRFSLLFVLLYFVPVLFAFVLRLVFFSTKPRDLMGRASSKLPTFVSSGT